MDSDTNLVNFQDIKKIYTEKHPPSSLFSSVQSKKALDKILIQKFNMVSAEKYILDTKLVWKKKKRSIGKVTEICETTCDAYIVPFFKNLKNLLENDEIRSNIENPKPHKSGIYRTVLDGSYYRENDFFCNHNNALAVILYYDDLGIANPLGAASKSQKLSVFYWTLGNIYPEFRSSKNAIQLYAILKTEYLKKPGALKKVLEPFIKDIVKLENEGITINVGTETKNFKGSLLFCAGDTPAAALLGGFKESVSAYRFCRSCLTTSEEYKNHFRDDSFMIRNKTIHNNHIEIVTDCTLTKAAKKFWQKTYGVMNKSPLLQSPNVDVTLCLPQDCMHILIKDPVEIAIRHLLKYCIFELQLFTLEQFNKRIIHFDYGHFKKDKPALILRDHLVDGSLRQSAAQIFTLAHMLPLLIANWIQCENPHLIEHINCYIMLLQIMNVCLAYEIHEESIELLSRMIEVYITRFINLYPDSIVPKFHFLIHVPRYIKLFGPPRQQWCFRFEACHAYFKSLVPIVRNFKNMALTMSYRHQSRLCSMLASYPGTDSKKFLYEGDYIALGVSVLLCNLPYAKIFHRIINESEWLTCQIMRSPKVIVHGSTYHCKSIILLECDEDDLPVFGEVDEIFIFNKEILLVISTLQTEYFDFTINSYKVTQICNVQNFVKNVKDLMFPYPLSSFQTKNRKYVPLINHERIEFYG